MGVIDEAQDGFVHGTRQGKLEVWVMAVVHIGEILVGEHLQYGRRHPRHTRFRIVAVPVFALGPSCLEIAGQIGRKPCKKQAGEV